MSSHEPSALIARTDLVTNHFGSWPSFHDAEVLRVELDRDGPRVTLDIEAFQIGSEVDERGYFRNRLNALIRFAFVNVDELNLQDFNQQNVLASFEVFRADEKLVVTIEPAYGLALRFTCDRAEVVAVEPRPRS